MRIDAHQHYWKIERNDYGWITPELPVLYRNYLPHDLEPLLRKFNMDGTIAVQAAPTIEETEYLLEVAEQSMSILGVVGWLDLFNADHVKHFEKFSKHPKFVGFRIMIQEMPDAERMLDPAFINALRIYAEQDVPVDLLVKSSQLTALNQVLIKVPGLRGVIDHIAKPQIAIGEYEHWAEEMIRAAAHPTIRVKLSGMVTEANHQAWNKEQFKVYIAFVLLLFGPDRVLFGSDWPVCLLAAEYNEVVEILEHAIPAEWGEMERAKLFGLNAKEFYKI